METDCPDPELADAARRCREASGLTWRAWAKALGVSLRTAQRYEHGAPLASPAYRAAMMDLMERTRQEATGYVPKEPAP